MKTRRPNSVKYISNALAVIPVEKGKFLAVYQTIWDILWIVLSVTIYGNGQYIKINLEMGKLMHSEMYKYVLLDFIYRNTI